MPIYNGGGGGVGGITVETDPSALKIASNLSDIQNFATARSNLQLASYFAALSHNHNGTYAPVSHSHAITDVTNLDTALSGKASSTHTHDVTDVTGWGNVNGAANNTVLGWNGSSLVWVPQAVADGVGDKYLTTSTTNLSIGNGNKTLTVGTGLSYSTTQSVTIAYDSSNHMHGEVLTYNSSTGEMTVNVNHHTGTGSYMAWTVNVGGVTPSASVAWGSVTGNLSSQTDLQSALDAKLPVKSVNSYASSYTLSAVDANQIVNHTSSVTATIPQDSTYNFPIGTIITVVDSNSSGMPSLSFSPEDTMMGVPTIVGGTSSSLRVVELVKVAANTWVHN